MFSATLHWLDNRADEPAIATRVAELLGLDRSQVNVKAKTGEKVGRQEAINADAVVLIERMS